jgi:aminotransferase
MIASLLATTDPEDEVIIFEPFYENYGPDADLCSARRVYVRLQPPDWSFDPGELRRAFSPRTKAIIVNTPHNPTGKVFSLAELELIAGLCQEYDALCLTDEIYEHIVYDGARHISMMSLPGMRGRTVTVNSMSKTFSATGWRVGWVIAAPALTAGIRKVHDFLTVGAAAPLQQAGVTALSLPDDYFRRLAADYQSKRDMLVGLLERAGFQCYRPAGAYYIMSEITTPHSWSDLELCRHLIETVKVAAVPGSSFLNSPRQEGCFVRFCFCKKYETLEKAGQLLLRLTNP